MQPEELVHSINHRGCGIRTASYPVGPETWLPEACVWLQTEAGLRRVWVHSFAHCFDAEKLTFPNKLDADGWALGAARTIIDRALEQLASSVASVVAPAPQQSESQIKAWSFARHPLQAIRRLKNSRHR
jgi:hypothetical protein